MSNPWRSDFWLTREYFFSPGWSITPVGFLFGLVTLLIVIMSLRHNADQSTSARVMQTLNVPREQYAVAVTEGRVVFLRSGEHRLPRSTPFTLFQPGAVLTKTFSVASSPNSERIFADNSVTLIANRNIKTLRVSVRFTVPDSRALATLFEDARRSDLEESLRVICQNWITNFCLLHPRATRLAVEDYLSVHLGSERGLEEVSVSIISGP